MAENLSYAVAGSKCYGEGGEVVIGRDENNNFITKTLSPAEVQANCVKYGRLYDWATAMNLPSSCNENSCSSQIQPKHKGICPSGWHLPSDDDWDVLVDYVGGYETALWEDNQTAGAMLKAKSGWNENGNGTDQYGFSALPGGQGSSDGRLFGGVGDVGVWWSTGEFEDNGYGAHGRIMNYFDDYAGMGGSDYKSSLQSVRCLQD